MLILQKASQAYIALDDTLFQHYVEEKSNPVVGALEHHMYAGQFDWNTCYGCQGVRRYVKEALMGMIEVHSEVRAKHVLRWLTLFCFFFFFFFFG